MIDKKEGNLEIISFDDFFNDARPSDMLEVEIKIVDYFNSNEYAVEQNIKLGKNYNNLMNQVVGAETD